MKFRKKPVVIDAFQFNSSWVNAEDEFKSAIKCRTEQCSVGTKAIFYIDTLEGPHQVKYDDWIIKGVKGEFYPCKPDIFEMTYERVEE